MANTLYIILTLLKAVAIIYVFVFATINILPAIKNNDRKKLRKIGILFLFAFLFIIIYQE